MSSTTPDFLETYARAASSGRSRTVATVVGHSAFDKKSCVALTSFISATSFATVGARTNQCAIMAEFSGNSRHASFELSARRLTIDGESVNRSGLYAVDLEAARTSGSESAPSDKLKRGAQKSLLEDVADADRVTLTWNDVNATVPPSMLSEGLLEKLRNAKAHTEAPARKQACS